ncbi:NAD(P)-binding domain-containing protein [Cesiribacter sp. SM1]|uniref:NAD(P)-binding domain-containing protein n=1 Tax=Cesiribacter sp. SM1 TaxID=2861196 RepID=UPI001CD21A70|nr:NAD(P)-binding domain-containing protein [Cesiribacter sp. SM1]
MQVREYPVAVIGGGPVGLAAAAHLTERNIPFRLFEAGAGVGTNLMEWKWVQVFSPWKYNIDRAMGRLLDRAGWNRPHTNALPTGEELVAQYLEPFANLPAIKPYLHTNSRVVSINRKGFDKTKTSGREAVPFVLRVQQQGQLKTYEASAIIDATGTWQNPNPIGVGGVPAVGEAEHKSRIYYGIPHISGSHKMRYAGKTVVVAGGGHSAINSLLELAALKQEYPQTQVHWVLITDKLHKVYGGRENDQLAARGALGQRIEQLVKEGSLHIHTPFHIDTISSTSGKLQLDGELQGSRYSIAGVDEIIANTGARPDLSFSREVRVAYHEALECVPALSELIDPNIHSCGTVRPHGERELRQPEKGYYVAGVKSYGRAPTFLMATGYEQVRSIAAYLDGDLVAAAKVELNLPETGVCSTQTDNEATSSSCCDTPASRPAINLQSNRNSEPGSCSPLSCGDNTINENSMNTEKSMNTATPQEQKSAACCGAAPAQALKEEAPAAATGCCGGPAEATEDACCKLDEEAKAGGLSGCGCGTSQDIRMTEKAALAGQPGAAAPGAEATSCCGTTAPAKPKQKAVETVANSCC